MARPDASLRIVQLNIGSLLEPGWDRRRHEIVAWLDELQPDIACFEEVWESESGENTARWIAAQLPAAGYDVAFGGAPFPASFGAFGADRTLQFGSAVLSRWPIEASEYHRLPVAEGAESFVAGIPWELLQVYTAGLDVFACHLAPAPTHGPHRRLQVLAIDDIVRDVRGTRDSLPRGVIAAAEMPPILCGDFNAEPDSDEIRFLSSLTMLDGRTTYYQDAWRVAGDGPGYTQDWRDNELAAGLNVPRKRIDYVFVGDPFMRAGTGRVLSAELAFHTSKTGGVLASDHAGLVVDVLWPERPEETS